MNGDDRIRSKEELSKLFAWWEKEMTSTDAMPSGGSASAKAGSPSKRGAGNQEDVPSDAALVNMAFGSQKSSPHQNALQKTARGYLKTQMKVQGKPLVKQSEYTFFKKRVRLNVVEKKVHEFKLDEEEISHKKAKKPIVARKNF